MVTKLRINLKIKMYLKQQEPYKKKDKINHSYYFSTNLILNGKIKKKILKNNNE